jgi:hypothetical protein
MGVDFSTGGMEKELSRRCWSTENKEEFDIHFIFLYEIL